MTGGIAAAKGEHFMTDLMEKRCRKICGGIHGECFTSDDRHLACIADMVINKVSAANMTLQMLKTEPCFGEHAEGLKVVTEEMEELIRWIRHLQAKQKKHKNAQRM